MRIIVYNKINLFKKIYGENKNIKEKIMLNILFNNETIILPHKYVMMNFDSIYDGLKYNE